MSLLSKIIRKPLDWIGAPIFTMLFIFASTLFLYYVTKDAITAGVALVGLVIANHSVHPLFYPVIKKSNRTSWLASYANGGYSLPPQIEDELPRGVHWLMGSKEQFTIRFPLFKIFDSIQIVYPLAKQINFETSKTKYAADPFVEEPKTEGNTLILRVRVSAWTIYEHTFDVNHTQTLSEPPQVMIGSISYTYPESIVGKFGRREIAPDEYGFDISIYNGEPYPVKSLWLFDTSETAVKVDVNTLKECEQDSFYVQDGWDCAGCCKGILYVRSSKELGPWESRNYLLRVKAKKSKVVS